jgi:hypothetical protein
MSLNIRLIAIEVSRVSFPVASVGLAGYIYYLGEIFNDAAAKNDAGNIFVFAAFLWILSISPRVLKAARDFLDASLGRHTSPDT